MFLKKVFSIFTSIFTEINDTHVVLILAILISNSCSFFCVIQSYSPFPKNTLQDIKNKLFFFYFGKNCVFKSNEHSEDSYIGLADFFVFFSGKSLKILMHFLSSIEVHLLKVT